VLLFLTPLFELVPYNAMGAIVLSSVLGLLEHRHAAFLLRANFRDFMVWAAAFAGTVTMGVQSGLLVAVVLALGLVIAQTAFPNVTLLGRLPGTGARGPCAARTLPLPPSRPPTPPCRPRPGVFRSVAQYPRALLTPHIAVVRVDAPIFFGNVQWVRARIDAFQAECDAAPALGPLRCLVLDMAPVSFLDAAGRGQ